jgi:multiple sugar transport system permease protein
MRTDKRVTAARAVFALAGWTVVFVYAFPMFWMISTSLRPQTELFVTPPHLLPRSLSFESFERLLGTTNFAVYFLNSLIVSASTTAVTVVLGMLGAHALVSLPFPGRAIITKMVLLSYLLPSVILLVPIYLILAHLGLTNTLTGLTIAYTTFSLPFALWLLRSFFSTIPKEIEQAALIDGASRSAAFFEMVLPQALPGVIATAVLTFILSWNEYLYALVIISDERRKTLPTGIVASLITPYNIEWGMVMAASVLASAPILIAFIFLQRYVVRGFGAGAVKG